MQTNVSDAVTGYRGNIVWSTRATLECSSIATTLSGKTKTPQVVHSQALARVGARCGSLTRVEQYPTAGLCAKWFLLCNVVGGTLVAIQFLVYVCDIRRALTNSIHECPRVSNIRSTATRSVLVQGNDLQVTETPQRLRARATLSSTCRAGSVWSKAATITNCNTRPAVTKQRQDATSTGGGGRRLKNSTNAKRFV